MILEQLKKWQAEQARREGVESYRVLPYKTLVELSHALPQNELELLGVKGIGAVKVKRYGAALLALMNADQFAPPKVLATQQQGVAHNAETGEVAAQVGDDVFSVSDFLSALNVLMSSHFHHARVRGEIVDFRRNHTGHAYFQIKDASGIMRTTVFRGAYELSGAQLADGLEVIVTGHPQHHAQYGFSFIGETVELAGEGALKKAYDALKKKCTEEGLLDAARKRPVPLFPTQIGLITSRDGAAIGDFMTNLARHGLNVRLAHSAVEGQHAVHDLRAALRSMHALAAAGEIDVLVLTRGGGSLESLQAFNNETIIRMIADFPVPVIAGIGHERDETLATLVADAGVSTPTAAAKAVCASWADAMTYVERKERMMLQLCSEMLAHATQRVARAPDMLIERFRFVLERFAQVEQRLAQHVFVCAQSLKNKQERIAQAAQHMQTAQGQWIDTVQARLTVTEKLLAAHDPHLLLTRGYAIVQSARGVVRTTQDVHAGDALNVRVSNGTIDVKVT